MVVYGAADPKAGAVHSLYRLLDDPRLNHRAEVVGRRAGRAVRPDPQPILPGAAAAGEEIDRSPSRALCGLSAGRAL